MEFTLRHPYPLGVWVNGIGAVDEQGGLRDCGRAGRVLREFAA